MYPQQKRRYPEATRGRVENEIARCIFCGLCEKNCPTKALAVSRRKRDWQIDSLRCCQCRRCVKFCPVKCLSMHDAYFPAVTSRAAGLYLVVGPPKETVPPPRNASAGTLSGGRYHRENRLERRIPRPRRPVKRAERKEEKPME